MELVLPPVGSFGALLAAAVVFGDATRRDWSRLERLSWAGSVGAVSFTGFLLPYSFGDVLRRVYLHQLKPEPLVASPYENAALKFVAWTATVLFAVALYGIASRYRSSSADSA